MQRGFLANGADAAAPVLIDNLILAPDLLAFVVVEVRYLDLGSRARIA